MSKYITLALSLLLSHSVMSQTGTLDLDTERSQVSFHVTHLGVLSVDGTFTSFQGSCVFDQDQLLEISGAIAVSSIDTQDQERNKTLLSEPYLDPAQYPLITFTSQSIVEAPDGQLTLSGELSVKSFKGPIAFQATVTTNQSGQVILDATPTLSREYLGLHFGAMDALIGDEITTIIRLVFH